MGLKIAIIGSGSTYCPELAQGLISARKNLPVDQVYLMDINGHKLRAVGNFFARMMAKEKMNCNVVITEDLVEAVQNADYVITQIRVGELPARILDEKIPLKYSLIGQETTGVGGFFNALRAIPAIAQIATAVEKYAPNAWLINFANPAGIVTEYLCNYTKVNSIGLCNVPLSTIESMGKVLGKNYADLNVDSVGLNHLSWITGVFQGDDNYLPQLMALDFSGSSMKNIPGVDADIELVRSLGGIPSSYLNYFYYREAQLKKQLEAEKSRGEICCEIELELLEYFLNPDNDTVPDSFEKRGGHLYSQAAISLIESLHTGDGACHVINVPNAGVLDFLADDDIIETTCRVTKGSYSRVPLRTTVNPSIKGLIQTVKQYEKLTVQAALSGNIETAKQALLCHPLVGDLGLAANVIEELLAAHRSYLGNFDNHAG